MKLNLKCKSQIKRLHLIYAIGFAWNFRPSEPFFYDYYINQKNLTETEFYQNIAAISTYSLNISLVVILSFSDILSHIPILIVSSLLGIISECLMIWGQNLLELQMGEVLSGIAMAGDLSFYIYIYNHVEGNDIPMMTGFVTAATLLGKTISYSLSQLLISQEFSSFCDLHYITLSFKIIAFCLCPFLPIEENHIYKRSEIGSLALKKTVAIKKKTIEHLTDKYVIKWIVWNALSLCAFMQVTGNIQILWKYTQIEQGLNAYNGAIEGTTSAIGILASLLGGIWRLNWRLHGDLVLTLSTLLQGFMIFLMCQLENVFLTYLFYVFYTSIYYFIITSLRGELARGLGNSTYGVIFGIIALMSALLSTIFVIILGDSTGYELQPNDKFMVYGVYYMIISSFGILIGIISWFAKNKY